MNTAPSDIESDESSRPSAARLRLDDLRQVTTDPDFDRRTNLLRLQGWRGQALAEASDAPWPVHRLGPAICGVLSFVVIATGSMALLLVTLASAIVGTFAANHPAESLYNAIATRRGRQQMPPNRAAKRTGCAVGSLFLAGAAIAAALGYGTVAIVLLAALGSLAIFVASTGICVPSIMSILAFGSDRGTRPRLIGRR